jgi:amino acid transporter
MKKKSDKNLLYGIISASVLVVLVLIIYSINAFKNGQTAMSWVAILIGIIATVVAFKYLKNRYSEVEKGMPLVDERTNKVFLVAAAKTLVISLWYLLILAWASNDIIQFRDPSQALGAGIIGMALILGIMYLWYNRKEDLDKVRF